MKYFTIFLAAFSLVQAQQPDARNTVEFSGGIAYDVNKPNATQTPSITSLGVRYGYRFRKYLEVEAGVVIGLNPANEIRGANYDFVPSDRFIWVPFGLRAVLPLAHGRIELSAGGGGLYEKYSVSSPESRFGLVPRQGWGGYASARAAVAVDHRRRFWLGVTPRLMVANPPYARDRWFVLTGDIGLRF